jgi:hypothetical protein
MATVTDGWLAGHKLCEARKDGPCQYRGCARRIEVGDTYLQGELDPYAPYPLTLQRWCIHCAAKLDDAAVDAAITAKFGPLAAKVWRGEL